MLKNVFQLTHTNNECPLFFDKLIQGLPYMLERAGLDVQQGEYYRGEEWCEVLNINLLFLFRNPKES